MRRKPLSEDMPAPPVASIDRRTGRGFCRADYHRRERQRQMKNDEVWPSEAAAEEFFPGV